MTTNQIRKRAEKAKANILTAKEAYKDSCLKLEHIQCCCPHLHIKWWYDADGYGTFKVEQCLDCGLQKDGGLRK